MRKGENIYKRRDGRWEARYVKEILPDGKKKYASVYAKSYAEVKEKQRLCRQKKPCKKAAEKMEFELLSAEWLDEKRAALKPSTYAKYEGVLRNWINPNFGGIYVRSISKFTVRNFTEKLLAARLSPQTVNNILIVLNSIFLYISEEREIAMPAVHYVQCERREMRVLSVSEQQRLMRYLTEFTDVYKLGVLLALLTGLRIGELCALQWSDVSQDTISVSKTMLRLSVGNGKTEVKICPPKSGCSVRKIPIPPSLKPILELHRGEGYVLSDASRGFTEPRTMQYKFARMLADCGIEKANFHALRHTFATRCIEAGVDAKTLSEMLGHSDVKTTLSRYVHSSFEQKQSSIARMEQLLMQ